MEEVAIYGFGSFFSKNEFQDIDILILHQSTSSESCQFAIWCKKYLLANVSGADITILSRLEERQFAFIEKSKARYLGNAREKSAKNDLDLILTEELGINALSGQCNVRSRPIYSAADPPSCASCHQKTS